MISCTECKYFVFKIVLRSEASLTFKVISAQEVDVCLNSSPLSSNFRWKHDAIIFVSSASIFILLVSCWQNIIYILYKNTNLFAISLVYSFPNVLLTKYCKSKTLKLYFYPMTISNQHQIIFLASKLHNVVFRHNIIVLNVSYM